MKIATVKLKKSERQQLYKNGEVTQNNCATYTKTTSTPFRNNEEIPNCFASHSRNKWQRTLTVVTQPTKATATGKAPTLD